MDKYMYNKGKRHRDTVPSMDQATTGVGQKRGRDDAPTIETALLHMALTGPLGDFWTDFYTPTVLKNSAVRQWKSNMAASHEDDFATLGARLYHQWSCCVKAGQFEVGCIAYLHALVWKHYPQKNKVCLEIQVDAGRYARTAIVAPVDVVVPFEEADPVSGTLKVQVSTARARRLLSLSEYKKAFCRLAPQLHRYFSKLGRCPSCNKVFMEYTTKDGRCTNCHWSP